MAAGAGVRSAAQTLRAAAMLLRASDCVVVTALSYWHRFVASLSAEHSPQVEKEDNVLAACLLLASKVEEEPRRIRDVINCVVYAMSGERLHDPHGYWEKKALACTEGEASEVGAPETHRAAHVAGPHSHS